MSPLGGRERNTELYNKLWANSQSTPLAQDTSSNLHAKDVVSYSSHGVPFLASQAWSTGGHEWVYVREQYLTIWQKIDIMLKRERLDLGGLIVWGQSGVDKTFFLQYALHSALSLSIPVVYCDSATDFTLFTADGVFQKGMPESNDLPSNTLVLIDSGYILENPPSGFASEQADNLVIQVTGPQIKNWSWRKYKSAEFYLMEPWSVEELRQVISLRNEMGSLGPNRIRRSETEIYYTFEQVFRYIGPSARHIFKQSFVNSGDPHKDFSRYLGYPGVLNVNATDYSQDIRSGLVPDSSERRDQLWFYASIPSWPQPDLGASAEYVIPTKFLASYIARRSSNSTVQELLNAVKLYSSNLQVRGALLEAVAFRRLFKREEALSTQVYPESDEPTFNIPAGLEEAVLPFEADDNQVKVEELKKEKLYTLPVEWYPLDGVFVLNSKARRHIISLQVTLVSVHDITEEAPKKLYNLCAQEPDTTRCTHLFIVPSQEIGQAVTRKWRSNGFQASMDGERVIEVGYSVLAPPGMVPSLDDFLKALPVWEDGSRRQNDKEE